MKQLNNKQWIVIVLCVLIIVSCTVTLSIHYHKVSERMESLQNIEVIYYAPNVPKGVYTPKKSYFEEYTYAYYSGDAYEAPELIDPTNAFTESFEAYINDTGITADAGTYNTLLYQTCDKYFIVYCGSTRVSPLFPMALANVESPGRANHDYTWSALFPSKYINPSMMLEADVTTVVSSDTIYNALSKDSSTRDRGALQMSHTYGTGDKYFNSMMSGNEKDKLQNVQYDSKYQLWVSGASSTQGDRFYLPDVCLRLSAAMNDAVHDMVRHDYLPKTDAQTVAMCAMYHHRSGVWTGVAKGGQTWNSSDLAYEYSCSIGNQKFVDALTLYFHAHPDKYNISVKEALSVYKSCYGEWSKYCSRDIVASYPIQVMYCYIVLVNLYGGNV